MKALRHRAWKRLPRGRRLEPAYRLMLKTALAGLNFGSVGSLERAERVALERLAARGGPRPVVFDVGAHAGLYAELALELVPGATLHCFEPNPVSFEGLRARIGSRARLHPFGLGDAAGEHPLFADSPGSSCASLHPQPREEWHAGEFVERGTIEVRRLDDVCTELGVERIDLLKLDVEGHELRALRGAGGRLEDGSIRAIQFELGPPALAAHATLADFFELLQPGYDLARLVPGGAVPVRYSVEDEIYLGVNYLATLRAT